MVEPLKILKMRQIQRYTNNLSISLFLSLSLTHTEARRLKAFYKMKRIFLRNESVYSSRKLTFFFFLLTFFGPSFINYYSYYALILLFHLQPAFFSFFDFTIHSYYHSYSSLYYCVKGMILT